GPAEGGGENLRVERGGGLLLGGRLVVGVGEQQLLVGQVESLFTRPRRQHGDDAGLPVDEGAVAVEAERLVLGQVQIGGHCRVPRGFYSASPAPTVAITDKSLVHM